MCGGERFWLSVLARRLVVLALVLFFAVSVTDASPIIALDHLRRDLGALQAQLEQIDAVAGEDAAQPVELDTDLGDGSPAFRRQILVTIASAALRNLERLSGAYRAAGDERRAGDAETLSLSLYGLTGRIERLAAPAAPATVALLRDQSRVLLADLVRELDLLAGPAAAGGAPAARPLP